jgi:hypothetical protein
MLTRLAVASVLVCILILLASACGWGGGSYGRSPYIQFQQIVLYQTAPGDPPRLIGHGSITSTGPYATATVEFFEIPCLNFPLRDLRSDLIDARTTSVELRSPSPSPAIIALSGSTLPVGRGDLAVQFPLIGTLKPVDPCAGNIPIHIEARPGPDLLHSWKGRLPQTAGPHNLVNVKLYQVRPSGRSPGALWAEVDLDRSSCGDFLRSSAPRDPSKPQPAAFTFALSARSAATISGLPSTLDPEPPSTIPITLTFTGGPCDAQTFTSTLTH